MKKFAFRKIAAVSMLLLCVFLAGCGCGKKKKDPASEQVLKITITPEPTVTPKPEELDQSAVVKNGNITMVNEYLVQQSRSGKDTEASGGEEVSSSSDGGTEAADTGDTQEETGEQ